MVIVVAAAIGAAAYGTYKGGQAAVEGTKKKFVECHFRKERNQERQEEKMEREVQEAGLQTMTYDQRLAKYKRESGLPSTSNQKEKKGLARFRRGKK